MGVIAILASSDQLWRPDFSTVAEHWQCHGVEHAHVQIRGQQAQLCAAAASGMHSLPARSSASSGSLTERLGGVELDA